MKAELEAKGISVLIAGVNDTPYEAGNDNITDGRDIPWLQDTSEAEVWASWDVRYRDLVILDQDNVRQYVFNLTDNDLNESGNYKELLQGLEGMH